MCCNSWGRKESFRTDRLISLCVPTIKVKVTQSCLSLPRHGILQARILEWVAVLFSKGSSQPRDQTQISHMAGRFFTSSPTRETLYVPIFTQSDQETCLSFHWPDKRIGINVTFYYQIGLNEPTPVLLPGKSHGRRSLKGCSPWSC